MNDMTENRMVIERAWPIPKALTRDAEIDQLLRDAMFRAWDWVDHTKTRPDDCNEILAEVVHACWRGDYKDDAERLAAIKASMLSFIEPWAENEADNAN